MVASDAMSRFGLGTSGMGLTAFLLRDEGRPTKGTFKRRSLRLSGLREEDDVIQRSGHGDGPSVLASGCGPSPRLGWAEVAHGHRGALHAHGRGRQAWLCGPDGSVGVSDAKAPLAPSPPAPLLRSDTVRRSLIRRFDSATFGGSPRWRPLLGLTMSGPILCGLCQRRCRGAILSPALGRPSSGEDTDLETLFSIVGLSGVR